MNTRRLLEHVSVCGRQAGRRARGQRMKPQDSYRRLDRGETSADFAGGVR
jgi:hypothetical protein